MSELSKEKLTLWLAFWFMQELPPGGLDEEKQAYYQIKALIQKPEVTEEWIEEKALELNNEILLESHVHNYYGVAKKFIRSLVEEMPAKKATVDEEFVEKWADKFDGIAQQGLIIDIGLLKQMLREVGVEVKK